MKKLLHQFIVFCGVGGINTIAALIVIYILSSFYGLHYITANLCGYGFGVILGFILHRMITFKDAAQKGFIRAEFKNFLLIFAIAYIAQLLLVMILISFYDWPEFLSQIAGIGVYVMISFLGNRYLTFSSKGGAVS